MKIFIFVVAVIALLWLLRSTARRVRPPGKPPVPKALPMATCQQCGMHLPRDEALPGRGGFFCGEAHRAAFETAHPDA